MIVKTFEINKKKFDKQNIFLVYGENEGLKNEIVDILKIWVFTKLKVVN